MARNKSNKPTNSGAGRSSPAQKKTKKNSGGGTSAPVSVGTARIIRGPKITPGARGGATFSHSEFVTDVISPTVGQTLPVVSLDLNPSSATFSWLSRVSGGFELYRYTRLRVVYTPTCATSTGGIVVGAFEYDANDPVPNSKQVLSGYDSSRRGSVWSKVVFDMACPKEWYFVQGNGQAVVGDARLSQIAKFYLGVFNHVASALPMGEVTIEYTVELAKPELSAQYLAYSDTMFITGSTKANLAGTSVVHTGDTVFEPAAPAADQFNLAAKLPGDYELTFTLQGNSATMPANGCMLKTSFVKTSPDGTSTNVGFLDWASAFDANGIYSGLVTLKVSVRLGDILAFTTATAMTVLQVARIRTATFKPVNN